jgi:hypothetical protein
VSAVLLSNKRAQQGVILFLYPVTGQATTSYLMDTFWTHYFLFGTLGILFILKGVKWAEVRKQKG